MKKQNHRLSVCPNHSTTYNKSKSLVIIIVAIAIAKPKIVFHIMPSFLSSFSSLPFK